MKRSVVRQVCLGIAVLAATSWLAGSAQAQCQAGGSRVGSPGGASAGMMASSPGMMGASMLSGPGSWAYDQMLGQALARQMAQQAYQKRMADQVRRAESLAKRQYWAAQRREQKAQSPTGSPGNSFAAANARSLAAESGTSMSLDILPSGR